MKYVLDVSVALCWVIPRPLSPAALRLRDNYRLAIDELLAPSIFSAEAASGLTKSERQKLIKVGKAQVLLTDIFASLPDLHPYESLLFRATGISSQSRSGLYDCLYVALAERERCQLVTADDKLLRNLQRTFPFVISLASLP